VRLGISKVRGLLLTAILWLCVAPSQATIALVQHANKDVGSGTSTTLAYGSNPTANNLLIGVFRGGGAAALPYTITDTIGNTWTGLTSNQVGGIGSLQIWWAVNTTTSADTVTFAISGTATSLRLAIYEYSGAATTSPVDAENNSQTNGSGNPASTSITPAFNNELIIGVASTGATTTATAGTNYTQEDAVPAAANTRLSVEDWVQTTSTATTAPQTITGGVSWMAAIAAFKPAGASSPTCSGSIALTGVGCK